MVKNQFKVVAFIAKLTKAVSMKAFGQVRSACRFGTDLSPRFSANCTIFGANVVPEMINPIYNFNLKSRLTNYYKFASELFKLPFL